MVKQNKVKAEFRTGSWPRYDYDLDAGTLVFSDGGVAKVRAEIQVIGSTGSRDWLWSWANDHWPASAVEDALRVCAFGQEQKIDELTTDSLTDENLNSLGWELTAVAARVVNAVGAYRPPSEYGALFLLYRSISFVS